MKPVRLEHSRTSHNKHTLPGTPGRTLEGVAAPHPAPRIQHSKFNIPYSIFLIFFLQHSPLPCTPPVRRSLVLNETKEDTLHPRPSSTLFQVRQGVLWKVFTAPHLPVPCTPISTFFIRYSIFNIQYSMFNIQNTHSPSSFNLSSPFPPGFLRLKRLTRTPHSPPPPQNKTSVIPLTGKDYFCKGL